MNDLVRTGGAALPAHIAKRMAGGSSLATSLSGGIDFGGLPRISIKGSTFRIIEGGSETPLDTRKLNVVIVGANPAVSKLFYAGKYTGNKDDGAGAPDCFSMDGVRPDMDAKHPQSDLCATCPNNQWGSKISEDGNKGKLCADQKRLAVVAANAPDGTVYLLQVTPAALRNLNDYVKQLSRNGYPPECVITELGFDTSASSPKLTFKFNGFISEDAAEAIDRIFDSPEVHAVTGEKPHRAEVAKVAAKPMLVREVAEAPAPPPPPPPPPPAAKKVSAAAAKFGVVEERPAPKAKAPRKEPEPIPAVSSSLSDDIAAMIEGSADDTDD